MTNDAEGIGGRCLERIHQLGHVGTDTGYRFAANVRHPRYGWILVSEQGWKKSGVSG